MVHACGPYIKKQLSDNLKANSRKYLEEIACIQTKNKQVTSIH